MAKGFRHALHSIFALCIAFVIGGCQPKDISQNVTYIQLVPYQTVVDSDDLTMINPSIIRFNPAQNEFYIYDNRQRAVFRVGSDGSFLGNIGQPGQGPGEFERVSGIYFGYDTIYLVDDIQLLVHAYSDSGIFRESFNYGQLTSNPTNKVSVGHEGHVYLPADHTHEHLFRMITWSGEEVGSFGIPIPESTNQIDYVELRSAVKDKRVPTFFMNNAFVIPNYSQNVIIYDALGSLSSYSGFDLNWQSGGASPAIQDSITLPYFEFMDQILQQADVMAAMRVYQQGAVANEFVYLSTNTSFGQEMQIHAFNSKGELHKIYIFDTETPLNGSFDIDADNGFIFAGTTNAEVVAYKIGQ